MPDFGPLKRKNILTRPQNDNARSSMGSLAHCALKIPWKSSLHLNALQKLAPSHQVLFMISYHEKSQELEQKIPNLVSFCIATTGAANQKVLRNFTVRCLYSNPDRLMSVYLLVVIVKKGLNIDQALHTMLQVLSIGCFEKMPILLAFQEI